MALPKAHAHNDYLHKHPLYDALSCGFGSVEADVNLRPNGDLCVAHFPFFVRTNRKLQNLYLDPLEDCIANNPAAFSRLQHPFILLIDIKTPAEPTFQTVNKVLAQYSNIVTRVYPPEPRPKPILAII